MWCVMRQARVAASRLPERMHLGAFVTNRRGAASDDLPPRSPGCPSHGKVVIGLNIQRGKR